MARLTVTQAICLMDRLMRQGVIVQVDNALLGAAPDGRTVVIEPDMSRPTAARDATAWLATHPNPSDWR